MVWLAKVTCILKARRKVALALATLLDAEDEHLRFRLLPRHGVEACLFSTTYRQKCRGIPAVLRRYVGQKATDIRAASNIHPVTSDLNLQWIVDRLHWRKERNLDAQFRKFRQAQR